MHAASIKNTLLPAIAVVLVLSACVSGPRQVRGELPLVSLDNLQRQGDLILLGLGLRNINDHPFPLNELEVRLSVGDEPLLTVVHAPEFSIGARGREVILLRGSAQPAGLLVLGRIDPSNNESQEEDALDRISWQMQVRLTDERGRSRETEAAGFLHPVPGQPGRFR